MKLKPLAVSLPIALVALTAMIALRPADAQNPPAASAAAVADATALVGKPAPGFTLPDQNDKNRSLSDTRGKWVVLAFYPADMTKGCTLQNKSYSDNADKFTPLNAVVYTVSTQDTASKREFCSKEGLKHTLLSDVGGKTAAAYGVLPEGAKVAKRVTFYIAPDGTVASVDTKPNVTRAADDSLLTLTKLSDNTGASSTGGAESSAPAKVSLKALVPDFALPDAATGKKVAFTTLSNDKKAAVILFISTQCPVSNAYNAKMAALATEFGPKGVAFIGINSNKAESAENVATHAKTNNLNFTILKDDNNVIADRFDARVTPEAYVTNDKGILVYHGNIEPQDDESKRNLATVLSALVEGKPAPIEATRAFGCTIKRVN